MGGLKKPTTLAGRVVMTTWHSEETLSDALWFFANCTVPDAGFESLCTDWIAVSMMIDAWERTMRLDLFATVSPSVPEATAITNTFELPRYCLIERRSAEAFQDFAPITDLSQLTLKQTFTQVLKVQVARMSPTSEFEQPANCETLLSCLDPITIYDNRTLPPAVARWGALAT